eukprot:1174266-Rhodomonas_salina.1
MRSHTAPRYPGYPGMQTGPLFGASYCLSLARSQYPGFSVVAACAGIAMLPGDPYSILGVRPDDDRDL